MKSPEQNHQPESSAHKFIVSKRIAYLTLFTIALMSGEIDAGEAKLLAPSAPIIDAQGIDWKWSEEGVPKDHLDQVRCLTEQGRFLGAMMEDARKSFKAQIKMVGPNIYLFYSKDNYLVINYENGTFRVGYPDGTMRLDTNIWIPAKGNKKKGTCQKDRLKASKYICPESGNGYCAPDETARIKVFDPDAPDVKLGEKKEIVNEEAKLPEKK